MYDFLNSKMVLSGLEESPKWYLWWHHLRHRIKMNVGQKSESLLSIRNNDEWHCRKGDVWTNVPPMVYSRYHYFHFMWYLILTSVFPCFMIWILSLYYFALNFFNHVFLLYPFYIQRMTQEKWAYIIPILKLKRPLVEGVVGVNRSGSAPLWLKVREFKPACALLRWLARCLT